MLENFSKYRTELMGFATLWVLLYHYVLVMNIDILHYVSYEGYGGVDMFLFLSGFGLTIGYKKYSLSTYYKRRFLRIYTVYIAYMTICFLISNNKTLDTIIHLLKKLCGIGFFCDNIGFPMPDWYIITITFFYLLFPLWMCWNVNTRIQNRKNLYIKTTFVVVLGLLFSAVIILGRKGPMLILATTRIPIFIIGSMFGFLLLGNKEISKRTTKIIVAFSIIYYIITVLLIDFKDDSFLWRNGLYWFPFTFATPGLLFITTLIFKRMPSCFNKLFKYVGTLSLEVYLFSCYILSLLTDSMKLECQQKPYLYFILFTFVSIAVSKLFQILLSYIENIIGMAIKISKT